MFVDTGEEQFDSVSDDGINEVLGNSVRKIGQTVKVRLCYNTGEGIRRHARTHARTI